MGLIRPRNIQQTLIRAADMHVHTEYHGGEQFASTTLHRLEGSLAVVLGKRAVYKSCDCALLHFRAECSHNDHDEGGSSPHAVRLRVKFIFTEIGLPLFNIS